MKKVLLLATAALLVSGVTFANTDKGKKKKCAKGTSCCQKAKACSKEKAAEKAQDLKLEEVKN
jgi:hypothetical protein